MAEGLARALRGNAIEAYSAGTAPKGIDPRAIAVMKEIGIDISAQHSTHVGDFTGREFDYVVTLCGGAAEVCPLFPGRTKVAHVGFDDPPDLARGVASEEEALGHYRRVRDEIRSFVEGIPDTMLKHLEPFPAD